MSNFIDVGFVVPEILGGDHNAPPPPAYFQWSTKPIPNRPKTEWKK